MPKPRLLVDTCVIIEAFRTNCWTALCRHFDVETVEACVTECCTGDVLTPGRVPIDRTVLLAGLAQVYAVDDLQLATLTLEVEALPAIDEGELHLMAWLHAHPTEAVLVAISTADRAAVRATHVLGLIDRVRSLQTAASAAGVGKAQLGRLQDHFWRTGSHACVRSCCWGCEARSRHIPQAMQEGCPGSPLPSA